MALEDAKPKDFWILQSVEALGLAMAERKLKCDSSWQRAV